MISNVILNRSRMRGLNPCWPFLSSSFQTRCYVPLPFARNIKNLMKSNNVLSKTNEINLVITPTIVQTSIGKARLTTTIISTIRHTQSSTSTKPEELPAEEHKDEQSDSIIELPRLMDEMDEAIRSRFFAIKCCINMAIFTERSFYFAN